MSVSEDHAPPVSSLSAAESVEDRFFAALVAGDHASLEAILTDDFLIIDVSTGAVADRPAFVAALREGVLEFRGIELVERLTRRYGDTAIIVGRTEMSGAFSGVDFAASSRYTHVLVRASDDDPWRLATAQGTAIADSG